MLQNTVTVIISFIVRVFKQLSFIMDNLTSLQRDLLFQSLNLVLHTKLDRLSEYDQEQFWDMYKKLAKVYPSGFHSQQTEFNHQVTKKVEVK